MNENTLKILIDQYMKKNKFDIWQLRKSEIENPFPVGTLAVYNIMKDKPISFKNESKMLEFFGFRLTKIIEKI